MNSLHTARTHLIHPSLMSDSYSKQYKAMSIYVIIQYYEIYLRS